MRYILNTSIIDVKEQFKQSHIRGSGKDAEFEQVSLGWFILIDGVCTWLFLSHEEPEFKPGDEVRITIEKVNDAKPS
jgi:hypothetical protein